jgi:hypothetical protein
MKTYKVRVIFTGVVTKEYEAENQKDLKKQIFSDFSVAFIDDYDVEDFEIISEEENG